MSDRKSRLHLSLLTYLTSLLPDSNRPPPSGVSPIPADDAEGLGIAIDCLSEVFHLEWSREDLGAMEEKYGKDTTTGVAGGKGLPGIFEVFEQAKSRAQSSNASASTSSGSTSTPAPSPEDKALAEGFKSAGNGLMATKDYHGAIEQYGKAIEKDPTNPVYWSNRAAAHSQVADHSSAVDDATRATEVDPNFPKGYSRLGHALFSSGRHQEAVDAYTRGLELEPDNNIMKSSLRTAQARLAAQSPPAEEANQDDDVTTRDAGGDGGAGAGGFPGMGGMPGMGDLAGLMSNPMIRQMAQNLMSSGGMDQLMNNPQLRAMAENMGRGGGMPDIGQLMNDPTMRNLANQFGGGQGGGGGGQ